MRRWLRLAGPTGTCRGGETEAGNTTQRPGAGGAGLTGHGRRCQCPEGRGVGTARVHGRQWGAPGAQEGSHPETAQESRSARLGRRSQGNQEPRRQTCASRDTRPSLKGCSTRRGHHCGTGSCLNGNRTGLKGTHAGWVGVACPSSPAPHHPLLPTLLLVHQEAPGRRGDAQTWRCSN